MTAEELTHMMLELAEGRLEPDEWDEWWQKNEAELESDLNRGEYLRIKPKSWGEEPTIWRAINASQEGAFHYLLDRHIPYRASFRYRDKWNEEFDGICKAAERKRKERVKNLKSQFPALFEKYPKFASSLQYTYDVGDSIGSGITREELSRWESANSIHLPGDIRTFFQTCNPIRLEGIFLELDGMRPLVIGKKSWWVLGEYWKDGDGDLLLFQPDISSESTPIYYYEHERDTVKKLCSGMMDLLEKKLAWFNRQK